MQIGLKRGTVQIEPYNPVWPVLFDKEKRLLTEALGQEIICIEHVGSTAVPGLDAKPLIDIIAGVKNLANIQKFIPILVGMGYEHMPERITANRAFFPKGPRELRTHHLSFVEFEGEDWDKTITFRDRLRREPILMNEYMQL